ncbi:MAG: M3 family metallopeptidase, partial [Elusimicrobiaceae bacterium]|nr:M3 family metallopeptidase [Elusimicrobiaceae bacterium]
LKEVDAIVQNPAAPTFDNTIVALERSGAMLTRVNYAFSALNSSYTNDELQKIEVEMAPKLAAHQDQISMNPALFARIDALYGKRGALGLDAESAQLLGRYYKQFVRAGAKLPQADQKALKEMNQTLSSLMTEFSQNLLKAAKDSAVAVDSVEELDGFSAEQIGAAAEAAKTRGLENKWVITLQNTTIQPALEQLKNRALRERVYRASINRNKGGRFDNTALISKIVELRARQAALLGYPNYASYSLEDESAMTPDAVNKMLGQLGPAALAKARAEAADIQKAIDAEAAASGKKPFALAPWDWAYYASQARKARFSISEDEVKPYLELNRVINDGLFHVAHELYGLNFTERKDLPVYQPDVRVFEVFNPDGSPLALFVFDAFKRDNKKGGAWMSNLVDQAGLFNRKPVITNNLNIEKPAAGQPVLMTFDEVETAFHEFGHALHGMLSDVKYPLLSGTNVPRDFVEYLSQVNEMWIREPAVLAHFARHYKTGEPMPAALLDKQLASVTYGQGFATTEYVAAAMLDQSWHQIPASAAPKATGVMAFEETALRKNGIDYAPIPPRYHSPYFAHAFSGGYSAGYYAYIWSEVLARDTGHWFHTHGGLSRANGEFFRAKILSRGRTMEPGVMFEQFYGQGPDIAPLLEYRGLSMPAR